MFSKTSVAAVLLTLAPSALAVGTARVVNNCGSPVFFANVAQNVHDSMSELPSSGFSQAYSLPNVGVSIKLAPTTSMTDVTQFEYTWANGNINYDISNINGNPFAKGGMELVPSMAGAAGYPSCQTVSCPAGEATCTAAYNEPNDVRTMVCPDASDLTMILCPSGSGSNATAKRSLTHGHRVHSRQFR